MAVFAYERAAVDADRLMLPRQVSRYLRLEKGIDASASVIRNGALVGHLVCHVLERGFMLEDYVDAIELLCAGRMRFLQADVDGSEWLNIERELREIDPAERARFAVERGHLPSRIVEPADYQAALKVAVAAAIRAAAPRFSAGGTP
ncbi:MAG TPA: hypothetical protein VE907_19710 [Gammaproteobacteria bacterium]|nr:hypothetical protein [Gammaproteobacteria bacterium]